jgi:hypothetical protein
MFAHIEMRIVHQTVNAAVSSLQRTGGNFLPKGQATYQAAWKQAAPTLSKIGMSTVAGLSSASAVTGPAAVLSATASVAAAAVAAAPFVLAGAAIVGLGVVIADATQKK